MKQLDVLYMCDDGFADITGVSVTSLLENNPAETIELTIYIFVVGISEENRNRFATLEEKYGQKIVLIGADEEYRKIQELPITSYRGSAMTNLRLRFGTMLPETIHRLLYLDSDTLICGSLAPLADFDFQGNLMGMVLDAYADVVRDKNTRGYPYYNAGVLLLDCDRWREEHWEERLEDFIAEGKAAFSHPDQDLFNVVCRDEIIRLPARYNFQAVHRIYSDKVYFSVLSGYYTSRELAEAHSAPVVLHMVRVLGGNPWHEDAGHPDTKLFFHYKDISPWKNTPLRELKLDFVIRVERILKKILPETAFLRLSCFVIRLAQVLDGRNRY